MKSSTWAFAFLLISCDCLVQCQNQNMLECGDLFEGQTTSMNLTVDNATFTDCDAGPNRVTCSLDPLLGATNVVCVQSVTQCNKVETTDGCRCLEIQGTKYTYELKFKPQSAHEGGNITCSFDCTIIPGSGKQRPTVTSSSECLNIELVDLCKDYDCSAGVCYVYNGTAKCDCPKEYTDDFCKVKLKDETPQDMVAGVAIGVGITTSVINIILTLLTMCSVICLHPRTEHQKKKLMSQGTIDQIQLFIQENFTCCCCCGVKVEVDANGLEENEVLVRLKYRSIRFYCLRDMPEKVRQFIISDILHEAEMPVYGNEPAADYPSAPPVSQPKYTGKGNGQSKKTKSDKEIPLSSVGSSSPPSETSGDEKTQMITSTKGRPLPPDPTSTGIGKSASPRPRLDPLKQDHSKMTSVERNSGAFSRELSSPVRSPLGPIPSVKQS